MKKKFLAILLSMAMTTTLLAGCGGGGNSGSDGSGENTGSDESSESAGNDESDTSDESAPDEYREPLALTVYSDIAIFDGEQSGWFAQMLKDKFNVSVNIVSGSLDANAFNAAVAVGELGDIVQFSDLGENFVTALKADLLMDLDELDLSVYPTLTTYFSESMQRVSDFCATHDMEGTYGFNNDVAMESGEWDNLRDPTYALQVRYDAWDAAGRPTLTSLEGLPEFLQTLQEAVPTTEDGEKVYAYGGFPDWEDCIMKFSWDYMTYYGYREADFLGVNYETGDLVNPLEEDSLYYKALKVNNQLYRMGLFDPESVSQDFNSYSSKLDAGRYLMTPWGWATNGFNTKERAEKEIGFVGFIFEDSTPQQLMASTAGGKGVWAIGANCENPERVLEIIEWLCTEEGIISWVYGPQGLTWDYGEDGVPYVTEFGWECLENGDGTTMPAEYGGGTYSDGGMRFDLSTLMLEQIIPGKTYSFSYKGWPCYEERYSTNLSEAWSKNYADGAKTTVELYKEKLDVVLVSPEAFSWTYPTMSDDALSNRALFAPVMKEGSWKCVYAETDEEFEQLWSNMVATCKSYGYDSYVEEKVEDINECLAACGIVTE